MKSSRRNHLCVTTAMVLTTLPLMTLSLSYNQTQLIQCTRLSQQLRKEIDNKTTIQFTRGASFVNIPSQRLQSAKTDIASATSLLSQGWENLFQAAATMKRKFGTSMMMLRHPDYVPTMPMYSYQVFDHSVGYDGAAGGKHTFKKSGIYLLEFGITFNTTDNYAYIKFQILRPTGTVKTDINLYIFRLTPPFTYLVDVTAGDHLQIAPAVYPLLGGVSSPFMLTLLQA